ncbi:MAG: RNA 2',3'-cyclic phosphodiesterase [archaeon]|nr:RNA 2',3'-cyclic phosphodiesterase [archaeon]
MRCFISAELPKNIKEYIADIQKKFNEQKSNMKAVKEKDMHITLKFLGDIKEETISNIAESLDKIVKGKKIHEMKSGRLKATIEKLSTFPDNRNIGGIWLDIVSRELKDMNKNIEKIRDIQVNRINNKEQNRKFKAHITLFRIKNSADSNTKYNILKKIETLNKNIESVKFTICNIELKKSTLTPMGPIYSTIKRYNLKNNHPR